MFKLEEALLHSKILFNLKLAVSSNADDQVPELVILRSKLISLIYVLAIVLCPIFAAIYYSLGDHVLSMGCLFATAMCLAIVLVPNTNRGAIYARESLTLTGFFLFILITFRSGGTTSPLMLWLMVCPILACIAGGKASGLIWSIVCILAVLGMYLTEAAGIKFEPILSDIEIVYLLSSLALMVFITSLMFRFDTLSVQLINKLDVAITRIHELAIRDELTGAYVRREILRLLDMEIDRSRRSGTPLTLALMDVDDFKQINDTHGHATGDLVLKDLSEAITTNKRKTDHFGRYGGEEFLLIMVGADLEAGRAIVERLHQNVKALNYAQGKVASVTLSIGLCPLGDGMVSQDLVTSADQAMYQAKVSGRNQMIAFEQSEKSSVLIQNPHRGQKRFEDLAKNSPTVVWISDRYGSNTYINKKWTELTGQTPDDAKGRGWLDMVHPEDRERVASIFLRAKESEQVFLAEYRVSAHKGGYRWVVATGSPRIDNRGDFLGYIGGVIDIQEGKAAQEALYVSNQRFQAAIEAVEGSMWITDAQGNAVTKQPQWEKLTGQTFEEYSGFGWAQAIHPDDVDSYLAAAYRSMETGVQLDQEHRLKNKDGEYRRYSVKANPVKNPDGSIREWVGVHTDITEKKANEERVAYLATHDALTNLPNRLLLDDRLRSLTLQRGDIMHAVLFMDLNRFKVINDTLGHSVGDQLLIKVAELLSMNLRAGDTVARIGGDEFVMILQNVKSEADVRSIAGKMLALLAEPIFIAEHELILNASIGVSIYPQDGPDAITLMRHADLAMYQAKEMGSNSIKFHDKTSNVRIEERLVMERDLRRALQNDELFLDYQPKVDIKAGRVQGLEALIRWNHPTRGLVSPVDFIPLAEEIGLINPIGEWVLRKAASQLREWQEEGIEDLKISVNLSVYQLNAVSFMPMLRNFAAEPDTDPSLIELEITESALMEKIHSYQSILDEIKALGFTLAIDDFGTGYSSLSYLKRLPIETLKIDRSFIMDIIEDTDDAAIVSATISMAHKMGLSIVAEGVETEEQVAFLQQNGCAYMQGYYFSKPLPSMKVRDFLLSFRSSRTVEELDNLRVI